MPPASPDVADLPDVTDVTDMTDLRDPGRVLLLSCYELGHAPHGLALPDAFLRRAGFQPRAIDVAVQELPDSAIDHARLIAISVPMHTALRLGIALIERIQARNPAAQLAFFGLYAPLNADLLRQLGAHHILGGECEAALVELCRQLLGSQGDVPSESTPSAGRESLIVLDKLDFVRPQREHLPPGNLYARFDPGHGKPLVGGYAETTRGCLDTCRHCPVPAIYRGRFFAVDRASVLDDIAAQVAEGARHITFGDPDFLNGPGHSMAVVREMHARWPELTFDITAQVSHLLRRAALLPELVGLGCAFAVTAVESLSDRVLTHLGKRHRRADFVRLLGLCRDAGLVLRPTFVTFTPWTELSDIRELFDFIVAEELVGHVDPIQLTIRLLVPPGSLLLEAPGTRDAFGELDPRALSHRWHHPDPRVDALQRQLAARMERAVDESEASEHTFAAMRALTYRAQGQRAPVDVIARGAPVPRLTESWFC